MQNILKQYLNKALLLTLIGVLSMATFFTSCEDDDEGGTNETELLSYGPMPIQRGAELRFIGNNLDDITSIVIPDGITLSSADFTEHTASSIKLIVPQDAEEGYLDLVYSGGTITTQTPIGFSEPISMDAFAVTSIKPGVELTLTGDYLNRVAEFIFTDRVVVDSADFVSKARKEIKLIVPEEAQTGKISLSNGAEDPIIIYSEEELNVVIPVVSEVTPDPVKPGATLTIAGTDLDLITSLTLGGDVEVTEFESQSATSLVVTVPTNATSGAVTSVLPSGIEIEVGDITLIEPTATIEEMADSYGVGETVIIAGTDLDLVTTAAFTGADAVSVAVTNGKLNLEVTEAAQSGAITLTTDNGTTITVDGFVTTKPVATLPSDATPLDELTIVSTLGSRVKTVMFGDIEAEATATTDGFSVIVPLEAETGDVTLVMDNEETVAAGSITINAFTFCAVSEFDSETTTVGNLFSATIVNGVNLTDVLINGESTKYLVVGDKLYVSVGIGVGENTLTLVSGTTENTYTISVVSSGIVENVIWADGPLLITWSEGGRVILPASSFTDVPSGSIMRFYFTDNNGAWAQAQVNDGQWGSLFTFVPSDVAEYDWWNVTNTERYYDVELTADMLNTIIANQAVDGDFAGAGIIIQGSDLIFSKVSIIIDYSEPTAIWEGSAEVSGWSSSFTEMTWGGYDFSGLEVGQTMHVYYTADTDATMRLGNGNWAALPSTIAIATDSGDDSGEGNIAITAGTSSISFTLTAEDIATIQNDGGLGAYGGDYVVTKVAIK